jgi:hypothetical protein
MSLALLAHIKNAGLLKLLALVAVHYTALTDYIIQISAILEAGLLEDFALTRPVDAFECYPIQPSHELYSTTCQLEVITQYIKQVTVRSRVRFPIRSLDIFQLT